MNLLYTRLPQYHRVLDIETARCAQWEVGKPLTIEDCSLRGCGEGSVFIRAATRLADANNWR